jgi:DNA polymerase-3 subunit alpha
VVTAVQRQISKKNGSEWGRITIEDFFGTATVLAFGDVWDQYSDIMVQDAPVLIRGSVSDRDRDEDDPPIFLDSVVRLAALRASGQVGVELRLSKTLGNDVVAAASEAFRRHAGVAPVFVRWENGGHGDSEARMKSRQILVDLSEELVAELRLVLGADRVRFVRV